MALVKSGTHGSGSPLMAYELHAEQTAGSGTKRTIKMTLKAKVNGSSSASFFGYAVDYYFTVNGTKTSQTALKSSARWYGNESYRSFTATVTVDVGTTSSKAITVGFTTVNSNGWGGSQSGSFTVGSTNTAPTWSSNIVTIRQTNSSGTVLSNTANTTENATKFPENISALYLSWTAPKDTEGGTMTYEIYEQVDNGSFAKIATTTSTNYTRSIGSGSSTQGKMYDYYVKVKDSGGLYASGVADATQVQKNTLTVATPTTSSSISYSSTNFTISWSGAKNTVTTSDANKSTFTYTLSSSNITVYNQTVTGTSATITIYKSGTVPSGCYVKFDDIKNFLKGSNYKGTLTFTLKTANKYGSSGTKTVNVSVNLQTNPNSFSFGSVSGTSTVNSTAYLIPANKQTTITWGASSDPLGGAITYDVYYSYDNGSTFTLLQSNLTTNTLTKSLPSITKVTSCKFKVTAKTTYGKTLSVTSGTQTLHYVGSPTIKFQTTRNQTNYTIKGTVTVNTSISNIGLKSISYKVGSTTTNLTVANPFTITRNLAEGSTESVVVTVLDQANSDLGKTGISTTVNVSRYNPMFSIREKGVGVNCVNSGSEGAMLKVNGAMAVHGAGDGGSTVSVKNTTSGVSGSLWSGTSGFVCQAEANYSLHLGGNNSTTDIVCYSDRVQYGKYIQMNNQPIKFTTTDSGNARIGYETSTGDVFMSSGANQWLRLKKDGSMTWKGQTVITNAGGTFTGSIYTGAVQRDTRITTGNNQIYNVNTAGTQIYFGNPSTPVQLEASKITLNASGHIHTSNYIYLSGGKARLSSNVFTCENVDGKYQNIYLGPASDGEARICAWGSTDNGYRPLRASGYYVQGAGNWTGNTITHANNGCYSSTAGYVVLRSTADALVYLQGSGVRCTKPSSTSTYVPILASAFTVSSHSKHKEEITPIDEDKSINTMEILKNTNVYTYKLKDDLENGIDKKKIGLIVEQATADLTDHEEEGVELYQMTSTLWDVCKKQQEKIEELQEKIEALTN